MGRRPRFKNKYLVEVDINCIISRLYAANDTDQAKRWALRSMGLTKDEKEYVEVKVTKLKPGDEYWW